MAMPCTSSPPSTTIVPVPFTVPTPPFVDRVSWSSWRQRLASALPSPAFPPPSFLSATSYLPVMPALTVRFAIVKDVEYEGIGWVCW